MKLKNSTNELIANKTFNSKKVWKLKKLKFKLLDLHM